MRPFITVFVFVSICFTAMAHATSMSLDRKAKTKTFVLDNDGGVLLKVIQENQSEATIAVGCGVAAPNYENKGVILAYGSSLTIQAKSSDSSNPDNDKITVICPPQ